MLTFLQQLLLDSQMGLSKQIQVEAEAIPEDDGKCLQSAPALERKWGKINVPIVIRKGTEE
jgi:hypothetical protein